MQQALNFLDEQALHPTNHTNSTQSALNALGLSASKYAYVDPVVQEAVPISTNVPSSYANVVKAGPPVVSSKKKLTLAFASQFHNFCDILIQSLQIKVSNTFIFASEISYPLPKWDIVLDVSGSIKDPSLMLCTPLTM